MCFKYLISTIKNSLEIGHINLGKWGQQREKKIFFPSKNFAWVTARTQVPEMAQTSPCLLMGEQHESVAPALLRQREGCWCCAGALRKIGLAFEVGRAWECCTTFILGAGTCWNSNYWETGLRQSEALPLPCKEVQFFYLKLVFLTSPNVKKQWSQATPASLPGKPGKVKWGLLLDSPTSAAVTEGFKKNPNKQTWAQERHALMSVLKEKEYEKEGFGLIYPLFFLSLPHPQHLFATSDCHICQALSPQSSGLCAMAGSMAGSCREVRRDKESHFHCRLAPPAACCPQDPPHASRYSRAPLHLTLPDGVPRGTPCWLGKALPRRSLTHLFLWLQ